MQRPDVRGDRRSSQRSALLALLLGTLSAAAQEPPENPEREAFFGELHLHTGFSFDAAASGTMTAPEDAYRYARGESVEYLGQTVRRKRPLDFIAVTDHAEYLGVALEAADPRGRFAATEWPQRLRSVTDNTLAYMQIFSASGFGGTAAPIPEFSNEPVIRSNWERTIAAAEQFNEPGSFTTFVAYEWSPMPGGAHLHRNVIFRGPRYPIRPFSSLDSQRPEDLWTFVEALENQGIDSLLIPHNPNLSRGLMFAAVDSDGDPITREYAARRLAHERLVEVAQNKGTSETRPEFGPDEFAGFELISLAAEAGSDPAGGYLRPALGRGLRIEAGIGINPFRFGMIGSSDFHSGVASTEEDNFAGALGRSDDMREPSAVLTETNPIAGAPAAVFSAGALTGVWAESNTRESIFAALERREAFATSGTRIRPRLFAGFGYADNLLNDPDWVRQAYTGGVPMGSELARSSGAPSLKLVVHALRDPAGANLDRIQIVKIWLDGDVAREAIYDVAWADRRAGSGTAGDLPPIGNTVDLATASYTNTIGAPQLGSVWTDPDFDPAVPAIYYARVLEIPTPRWSTYLAVRNGLPLTAAAPATIQERAWTSPVFYAP